MTLVSTQFVEHFHIFVNTSFANSYRFCSITLQSLNYKLSKKQSTYNGQSAGILMDNKINGTINDKYPAIISDAIDKYNELTQSKMTSYSEFASWNHLDHVGPYW